MTKLPRTRHLVALLLLAACGKSSTAVVDPKVSSVQVSPSGQSVEVGLTVQFTASAFDANGVAVTGETVTWSSTTGSVASVDANGLAMGLAPGSTQIGATIAGITSSQTLTVTASSCTARTDVVLSPGEYERFPGDACLLLPAGAAGDLYRVAVGRPTLLSEDETNVSTVTLSISPVLSPAAAGPDLRAPLPVASLDVDLPPLDAERLARDLRRREATQALELEIWRSDRLLPLDASRVLPSRAPTGPARVDPPATTSLFVDKGCSASTVKRPVTRVGFNDNLVIYQLTSDYSTDPITAAAAQSMLDYFDTYVKDMIVAYWGTIPDTDSNARLIVVTTTAAVLDDAAAFVTSRDFLSTFDCPSSNEGEVIYFDAGLIRDLVPADPMDSPNYYGLGVVAHEAKHIVSVYNGILRGYSFNDRWVEEGTAEISTEIASRLAWADAGGPAINSMLTASSFVSSGITKENYPLVVQLAGVINSLSSQPNSPMNDPTGAPSGHSFYDMSWLWHRALGDGFGDAASAPEADSAFFHLLHAPATPAGGASGEIQLTGVADFDELFENFVVTVSFHGSGYAAPHPITTWNLLSAGNLVFTYSDGSHLNPDGSFPWPATATETRSPSTGQTITSQQWAPFAAASFSSGVGPSGVRFHDFRSSGSAAAEIRVAGAAGGMIVVTRLD